MLIFTSFITWSSAGTSQERNNTIYKVYRPIFGNTAEKLTLPNKRNHGHSFITGGTPKKLSSGIVLRDGLTKSKTTPFMHFPSVHCKYIIINKYKISHSRTS